MKVVAKTDPGLARENNEDWYIVDEEIKLFLVADGIGGHQAGEIASRLGAETIQQKIKIKLVQQNQNDVKMIIKEAIDSAHKEIFNKASSDSNLSGMGTTVVLGLYRDDKLYVAHVGDSRAYLINDGSIKLLTEDHSLVAGLVRNGSISEKQARTHKMRHMITQCIGCNEYLGPDIQVVTLSKRDIFLLCTDGLTDMVEDEEIRKILLKKRTNLQKSADELVKVANKLGGRDNITIILIENA